MATTPKGIYYPNDYNEIADIPEDMKKMAESIEEVFEDTDSDLSDIKEEQTTQNNRLNSLEVDNTTNKSDILTNKQEINNIKTEQTEQNTNISTNATNIESLQEENENLKKVISQLPQVTGQGTEVTLENTIEAQFTIFDVEGNSDQETTEGYQLFDIGKSASDYSSNVGNSLVINEKSIQMKVLPSGQTITYRTQNLIGNKKYTINGNASLVYSRLYVRMRKNDDSGWLTNSDASIEGWSYNSYYQGWYKENEPKAINQTVTIPECKYWQIGFGFNSLEAAVNTTQTISDIMLNEGTSAHEWEKYTGGIASPNPNYEQPIYSAGDNENLVNESNINFTYSSVNKVIYDNGLIKTINSPNGQFYEFDEPLQSGETYTLTFKFVQGRVNVQGSQDFSIGMYHSGNNNSWQGNLTKTQIANIDLAGKTFTLTHKATDTITGLYIFIYSSPTFVTPLWFNVKVEKGNKASGYSPYGMGSINEKIQTRNFIGLNKLEQGTFNGNGEKTNDVLDLRVRTKNKIFLLSGKYTINVTNMQIVVYRFDFNNILYEADRSQQWKSASYTFTMTSNGYVNIAFKNSNGTNITPTDVIMALAQLEPGSTSTPYVPHEEQDYPIFVQQPMRSIGDVRDGFVKKSDGKLYERHYIGEVVLDGTEGWMQSSHSNQRFIAGGFNNALTNSSQVLIMSEKYRGIKFDDLNSDINYTCYSQEGWFGFNTKNIVSLSKWKEELSNDNLRCNYVLAEPLDLPCTEEQIQQIENKPSTYKDFTIIQSEDETPAYLEVSGIYDMNKLITRVEVLESEV